MSLIWMWLCTKVAYAKGPHHLREAKVKPKACLYIISKEVTKHLPEKEKIFVSC